MIKKLNHLGSFLEYVKFGAMFWQRFYNINDWIYGLSMETDYVTYRTHANLNPFLLAANLIYINTIALKTKSVQKSFLNGKEDSFDLSIQRNLKPYAMNRYCYRKFSLHFFIINIYFSFADNENNQVNIWFKHTVQIKEVKTPKIEKFK